MLSLVGWRRYSKPMSEPLPSRSMLEAWYARLRDAKPFLRWAGGKQSFLFRYADRIPSFSGSYLEPFLGSGAVFFYLTRKAGQPKRARLGDVNKHLVRTFLAIRDHPDAVYKNLVTLQAEYSRARDKGEFYYKVRERHNALHPRTDPAVFIFLNRTCWNGLYRVNQFGKFNVPYGAPKREQVIPDMEDILNASAALTQSEVRATTWQNTIALAQPGDFVFLDPPYYSDMTQEEIKPKYQTRPFTLKHHEELASALAQLAARGVGFLLTNSGEPKMAQLYARHGLRTELVALPRAINSKPDQRTEVPELIVTPATDPVTPLDLDAEVLLLPDR